MNWDLLYCDMILTRVNGYTSKRHSVLSLHKGCGLCSVRIRKWSFMYNVDVRQSSGDYVQAYTNRVAPTQNTQHLHYKDRLTLCTEIMLFFTFVWLFIVTIFFMIKTTRCTNFTNLFWHETLIVSNRSSLHHQEFIHCTLNNGICHTGTVHTAVEQDQNGTAVPSWSCSKAVYKPVWHIPLLSVQWINSW